MILGQADTRYGNFWEIRKVDKRTGLVLAEWRVPNLVTFNGRLHLARSLFNPAATVRNYKIGLIEGTSTPTIAATNTATSRAWAEARRNGGGNPPAYTARGSWNPDTVDVDSPSSGSYTLRNSTFADIDINNVDPNSTGIIRGAFIVDDEDTPYDDSAFPTLSANSGRAPPLFIGLLTPGFSTADNSHKYQVKFNLILTPG